MLPTISFENIATKSDLRLILVRMFLPYTLCCKFTRRISVTVPIRRTQVRESSESRTKKVVSGKPNKSAFRVVGNKRECRTLKLRSDAAPRYQNYSFPKGLNVRFSFVKRSASDAAIFVVNLHGCQGLTRIVPNHSAFRKRNLDFRK